MDRREWRRRDEILAGLNWERTGDVISPALSPGPALRNLAANLALSDPAWVNHSAVSDPLHFGLWKEVSIALQQSFREWIPQEYFRETERFIDREAAHSMIVYQAARIYYCRSRGAFTYDLHDYPECRLTIQLAMKMSGRCIQTILSGVEQRLNAAGMPELARRYAPVWYQDVTAGVRRKPKLFIELLAAETGFIDALMELGMNRSPVGIHRFSKASNLALRKVYGMDLRGLGLRALEEATRVLTTRAGGVAADDAVQASRRP